MEGRTEKTNPLLLFAAAVLIRAVFVSTLPSGFTWGDEAEYHRMVDNFLTGRGLIVGETMKAFRPPLFPLFASFFYLTGSGIWGVRCAQVVLSAATAVLIVLVGQRCFSRPVGWLAGWTAAFYPFFIYYTGFLLTETLCIFLAVLAVFECVNASDDATVRHALGAGACLGLAGLCRPTMQLYLPLALGILLVQRGWPARFRVRKAAALLAVFCATVSPWVIRNAVVLHRFIPGTTMGGWVLWEGNNRSSDGGPCQVFPPGIHEMGEIERDRLLTRMAVDEIRADPARFRWLLKNKFVRFWNVVPNFSGFRGIRYQLVSILSFGVILPFFCLGFLLSLANRRAVFLHAIIVLFTAFHMVWLASIRYRAPVEPFVIILGAYGFLWLTRRVRKVPA